MAVQEQQPLRQVPADQLPVRHSFDWLRHQMTEFVTGFLVWLKILYPLRHNHRA